METNGVTAMTPSEWELMRVIWTAGEATSNDVIHSIQHKRDWSESTIKTLLGRLVKKEMLTTQKSGRQFIYRPTTSETKAANVTVSNLFSNLCAMKKGTIITTLVSELGLSKNDITQLQEVLEVKKQTAPEVIECDCIVTDDGHKC